MDTRFRIRMKEAESRRRLSKRQRSLGSLLRVTLGKARRDQPQRPIKRMVHPSRFVSMAQMGILSTMMTTTTTMVKEDPIGTHGDVRKMVLLQEMRIAGQANHYLLLSLAT